MFSSRVTATPPGPLSCLAMFELTVYIVYFAITSFILNYSIGPMSDRHKVNSSWIPTVQVDSFDAEDEMENRSSSERKREIGPAPLRCATSGAKLFQLHNSWYLIALRDSGNAEGWKRLSFCSRGWCRAGWLQCTVQGMYAAPCMQHCTTALQMMR